MKLKVRQTYENAEYVNAPVDALNFLGLKIRQASKYSVLYSDVLTPVVLPYTDTSITLSYNVWTVFESLPLQKIQITSNIPNCYITFLSGINGDDGTSINQGNLAELFLYTSYNWNPNLWQDYPGSFLWVAFGPNGTFWLKNKLTGNSPIQLTLRYFDPE